VISFLFHSGTDGPKACAKTKLVNTIIGTKQLPLIKLVVLRLATQLITIYPQPERRFLLFIDNLFLDGTITRALLYIGVLVYGTTRKNVKEFPDSLKVIKQHNKLLV
jgi:hypothetical protein